MRTKLILVPVCAALLVACGGGGGGGEPTAGGIASLQGPWYGFGYSDVHSAYVTWRLDFDGSGNVTLIECAGIAQSHTAVATEVASRVFQIQLDGGAETWHMWTDASGEHAGLVRGEVSTVLEHRTTDLVTPVPEGAMLPSSWSGDALAIDASYAILALAPSNLALGNDGGMSGNVGATTFANSDPLLDWAWNPSVGRGVSTYTDSTGQDGYLALYLSPDRTFAFGVAVFDLDDPRPCCDDRLYFLFSRN